MSIAIRKLISKLEAQLVAEDSAAKRKAIFADIEAAKKTLKHTEVEHVETETTDPPEEKSEDEPEEKKAEDPPADDDDKEDEDDDEEAAATLAKALAAVPGKRGDKLRGHVAALTDKARAHDSSGARIAAIEKERAREKREALITGALRASGGPRVTPATAKWLRTQSLETVSSYLAQHTKPIVNTEETLVDDGNGTRSASGLNAEAMRHVRMAVQAGGGKVKEETLVAALLAAESTGKRGTF